MKNGIRLALVGMTLTLVASGANAAGTLEPLQVFDDAVGDNATLGSDTPAAAELIAGYIGETDNTVDFTWKMADTPDGSGGLPEGVAFFWEFQLDDNDGVADPVLFALRARPNYPLGLRADVQHEIPGSPIGDRPIGGGGSLQGDCVVTGTVTTCKPIRGSYVKVTVDDLANTITASVRRIDLRAADGQIIGVDGSVLTERKLPFGIAACVGVVLISAALCDEADLNLADEPEYVFGR